MPESGKVTLKAQLAGEVAHIRRVRPQISIGVVADGAVDNWTFLEGLSPETKVIDFWQYAEFGIAGTPVSIFAWPRTMRWHPTVREAPRDPAPRSSRRRQGDPGVVLPPQHRQDGSGRVRARVGLLPKAPSPHALPRPQGRGYRHRLGRRRSCEQSARYSADEKQWHPLVDRRWPSGSDLSGLIKSGPFDRACAALMGAQSRPVNDNGSPTLKSCKPLPELRYRHARFTPVRTVGTPGAARYGRSIPAPRRAARVCLTGPLAGTPMVTFGHSSRGETLYWDGFGQVSEAWVPVQAVTGHIGGAGDTLRKVTHSASGPFLPITHSTVTVQSSGNRNAGAQNPEPLGLAAQFTLYAPATPIEHAGRIVRLL